MSLNWQHALLWLAPRLGSGATTSVKNSGEEETKRSRRWRKDGKMGEPARAEQKQFALEEHSIRLRKFSNLVAIIQPKVLAKVISVSKAGGLWQD